MSPSLEGKWIHESIVPVHIGGAELNVASALALWNQPVRYVTAVPSNYISREVIHDLTQRNIDCSEIQISGERMGIYYLPQGTDLKNEGVIYDRNNSSFAELQPGTIEWKKILQGCDWFHFSAISPALSKQTAAVCREAVDVASSMGLTISIDLNYRAKLWQYGEKPESVMPAFVQKCDLVMGNLWSAETLLGIRSTIRESTGRSREELTEAAGLSMRAIHDHYPNVQGISYTFRLEDLYYAVLQRGPDLYHSREFYIHHVVDRVGSGDCFMAGLIYGWRNQMPGQQVVDFASAAAVGKLGEKGDATRQSLQSILSKISTEPQ